jgi:hypothetical protein
MTENKIPSKTLEANLKKKNSLKTGKDGQMVG